MQQHFLSDFNAGNLWSIKAQDMTTEALCAAYTVMESDGLDSVVFYDGSITGAVAFAEFAISEGMELRCIFHERELCGVVWLNNPLGVAFMVHFCIMRSFFQHQREIGLWTVRHYLEPINPATGRPYISALYGVTPKVFRHALKFIQTIGFKLMGVLPGACEFQAKDGPVYRSGIASVLTLADIPTD